MTLITTTLSFYRGTGFLRPLGAFSAEGKFFLASFLGWRVSINASTEFFPINTSFLCNPVRPPIFSAKLPQFLKKLLTPPHPEGTQG